jgi:hypothetical protein
MTRSIAVRRALRVSWRTLLAITLSLLVVVRLAVPGVPTKADGPLTSRQTAKSGVQLSPTVADPFNARLAIQVGANGRFNMGAFPDPTTGGATTGSWDLMYNWPSSPGTSFSTLRIDGADNVYGSAGTQVEAPTDIDASTNESKWRIGDIEVTQVLQIVFNNQTGQNDVAKIAYTVRNTGAASHAVGLRATDGLVKSKFGSIV